MRDIIAGILVGLGIMGMTILSDIRDQGGLTPAPAESTVIEEDHPDWNCHTMGNMICGPGH